MDDLPLKILIATITALYILCVYCLVFGASSPSIDVLMQPEVSFAESLVLTLVSLTVFIILLAYWSDSTAVEDLQPGADSRKMKTN